jgi:Mrp family chromosome partitioning ATPase
MRNESAVGRDRGSDYFRGLGRHWKLVAVGLVIGTLAALAYTEWAPQEFRAETSVLVTPTITGTPVVDRSARINLDTEARLVTSTATVASAAERLGIAPGAARELGDRVRVGVPPNSEVLDISFTASTPEDARRGSLAFAEAYLERRGIAARAALDSADEALDARIAEVDEDLQAALREARSLPESGPERRQSAARIADLNAQLARLGSQQDAIRSAVVTPGRSIGQPALPSEPSSPDRFVTLASGIALGLLAGVAMATARHRSDDRIRSSADLTRSTGLPVAAALSDALRPGSVAVGVPGSPDARGYVTLRNLVMAELDRSDRRVVLVAGTRRSGGSVAANLAVGLARAGEEVVLVCADVHGSTATDLLGGTARPGLVEALHGRLDLDRTVPVDGVPGLRVLGAGHDPDCAEELLHTNRVRDLVAELRRTAGYVVVEAPPAVDSPAGQTLAKVAEVAVLVVELGRTTARDVLAAADQFEAMGTRVMGAVTVRQSSARRRAAPGVRRTAESRPSSGPADDEGRPHGRPAVPAASTVPTRLPVPPVPSDRGVAPR